MPGLRRLREKATNPGVRADCGRSRSTPSALGVTRTYICSLTWPTSPDQGKGLEMAKLLRAASGTLRITILGAFVTSIAFVGAGVWLVYLGASGTTNFSFFGQTFASTNVGIAALFLGAVSVVLLLRRSLGSFDKVIHYEAETEDNPLPGEKAEA